jgi:hypothetical protein
MRTFFTWFRNSIRNPDNFPHYLTAIFTFGLAVFACYAWLESRRGSRALEGQLSTMQLDQRPLVWVIHTEQPHYDDANRQFLWKWYFANIGKGIAYRVVALDYLKIGNELYQRSYGAGRDAKVLDPPPPTTLPPTTLPPIPPSYHTATSRPGTDKDFFDQEMNTNFGIGLLIDFQYSDASGKTIFTNSVCIERMASSSFANQNPETCLKGR